MYSMCGYGSIHSTHIQSSNIYQLNLRKYAADKEKKKRKGEVEVERQS